MEDQKVISLQKAIENYKLQETLKNEPTNIERYKGDYKLFQKYCDETNQELSGETLVFFLHYSLVEQNVKKNTFNRRYFACKKMLELDGVELKQEEIDIIKKLRKQYRNEEYAKKAIVKGKGAVDSSELLAEIHALGDVRAKAILLVQFYTGCRPSEMVLLKMNDFQFEQNIVNVYLKKQRQAIEKRLPNVCVEAIKKYAAKYNLKDDMYFVGCVDKHDNYTSREISLAGYNELLKRQLGHSAYVYRKSLVRHMFKKGADVSVIQLQTGHKSVRTITEHYLDVDKGVLDDYL